MCLHIDLVYNYYLLKVIPSTTNYVREVILHGVVAIATALSLKVAGSIPCGSYGFLDYYSLN